MLAKNRRRSTVDPFPGSGLARFRGSFEAKSLTQLQISPTTEINFLALVTKSLLPVWLLIQ